MKTPTGSNGTREKKEKNR